MELDILWIVCFVQLPCISASQWICSWYSACSYKVKSLLIAQRTPSVFDSSTRLYFCQLKYLDFMIYSSEDNVEWITYVKNVVLYGAIAHGTRFQSCTTFFLFVEITLKKI